jgi:archaellum component FlaG (FlaF/FlaG flagellin family)
MYFTLPELKKFLTSIFSNIPDNIQIKENKNRINDVILIKDFGSRSTINNAKNIVVIANTNEEPQKT